MYFAREQQPFSAIRKKFVHDAAGVAEGTGFVFVTNQELTLSDRETLASELPDKPVELFHLERIAAVLDTPLAYGTRLEFLDIEMSKEEQISFIRERDRAMSDLMAAVGRIEARVAAGPDLAIPLAELHEFQRILQDIAGPAHWFGAPILSYRGRVQDLRVPLPELRAFHELLQRICGTDQVTGAWSVPSGTIRDLRVPLGDLRQFASLLSEMSQPFAAAGGARTLGSLTTELRRTSGLLERFLAREQVEE